MDGVGCVGRSVCESISGFRTGKKIGHGEGWREREEGKKNARGNHVVGL